MKFIRAYDRTGVVPALAVALLIFCQASAAQDNQNAPQVSKKEADLAKKLQEGTDVAAKVKTAEKFVKDFPKSPLREQVARYTAGQIGGVTDPAQKLALVDLYLKSFTDPVEARYVAPSQIESYTGLKRYDEAFKLGGDYLAQTSDDLFVRLHLTVEGSNLARSGNTKYADQTRNFAVKAIEIIESGKKPADLTDAQWAQAQGNWLAQFYQSVGFLNASAGKTADALASFEKASKADPKDVNNWAMMGFIINQNYQELAKQYTIASSAEQPALKQKAEAELDKVIDIYARVVAMTDGVPAQANLNAQIRGDLESYYKYRHKNSTEGLQALIDKYKAAK